MAPILIAFAGLCAYCNSFSAPFLFDDYLNIVNNPYIRRLWPLWDAMSQAFWFNHAEFYTALQRRPFTSLTFALNYTFGGLNVWGYHAVNLAIHIFAALILFGIVRRTFLLPKLKVTYGAAAPKLAFLISLIWMIHPVQTESVTYIFQRCESLAALFFLATLYCFIRSAINLKHKNMWLVFSVISCALGMTSKEIMVTAPIIVLLYQRIFIEDSFKIIIQRYRWFYIGLAMTYIIFTALIYQRLPLQGADVRYVDSDNPHLEYILSQPAVILHYLKLAFWPASLSFYYGRPFIPYGLEMILAFLVVVTILIVTVRALRFRPAFGFLGTWFFLILAPTSSIRSLNMIAAEHRMYLPLAAVVCLMVIAGYKLLSYFKERFYRKRHLISSAGFIFPILVVVILGVLTFQRNETYQSALSLWADTVRKQPNNDKLRYQFGKVLFKEGLIKEAVAQYAKALDMNSDVNDPFTAMKHGEIALSLMLLGNLGEAERHLARALQLDENFVVHNSLGNLFMLKKDYDKAVHHYSQAAQKGLDRDPVLHYKLGVAYLRQGEAQRAIEEYSKAISINPNYAAAHNDLKPLLLKSNFKSTIGLEKNKNSKSDE